MAASISMRSEDAEVLRHWHKTYPLRLARNYIIIILYLCAVFKGV